VKYQDQGRGNHVFDEEELQLQTGKVHEFDQAIANRFCDRLQTRLQAVRSFRSPKEIVSHRLESEDLDQKG
jgi:hypothetical protein